MKKKMNLLSMSKNELKDVNAGAEAASWCYCGCFYSDIPGEGLGGDYYGGSSIADNGYANQTRYGGYYFIHTFDLPPVVVTP